MVAKTVMTPDEIVAYLKRASLPAILVEGADDMAVYRWIEDKLPSALGFVLPCGGRRQLLNIVDRYTEYADAKVAFLADSDCDLFRPTLVKHKFVIWTHGYSIENDLLTTQIALNLMTVQEREKFEVVIRSLGKWFCEQICNFLDGKDPILDVHSLRIVDIETGALLQQGSRSGDSDRQYQDVIALICQDSCRYIRGKNIFDVLVAILSSRNRQSKYSRANLYELSASNIPQSGVMNNTLSRIQADLSESLNARLATIGIP